MTYPFYSINIIKFDYESTRSYSGSNYFNPTYIPYHTYTNVSLAYIKYVL